MRRRSPLGGGGGGGFVCLTLPLYFFSYLCLLACGLACPVTHLLGPQALKSVVSEPLLCIMLKISRRSAQSGAFIISRLVLIIHKVMTVQKMRAVKTQKARADKSDPLIPRGVLLGILGGVCRLVLQILTRFQTKKCNFLTRFQTKPLKSIPVFSPGLLAEIMLSLLRLDREQTNSPNPFRIRIFLFLSLLELPR